MTRTTQKCTKYNKNITTAKNFSDVQRYAILGGAVILLIIGIAVIDSRFAYAMESVSDNLFASETFSSKEKKFTPECQELDQLNKIGNFADALECYQRIVERNPDQRVVFAHIGMTVALIGLHDLMQAEKVIDETISKNPGNIKALNAKALLLYKQGEIYAAKAMYEQVISKHSKNMAAHIGLGHVYRIIGEMENATYHYWFADELSDDRSESHKSQNSDAKNGYGLMNQAIFEKTTNIGNLGSALLFHAEAIKVDDQSVDGFNGVGTVLTRMGFAVNNSDFCSLALDAFDTSLEIYSENQDAIDGKGYANYCIKRIDSVSDQKRTIQQDSNFQKPMQVLKEIL